MLLIKYIFLSEFLVSPQKPLVLLMLSSICLISFYICKFLFVQCKLSLLITTQAFRIFLLLPCWSINYSSNMEIQKAMSSLMSWWTKQNSGKCIYKIYEKNKNLNNKINTPRIDNFIAALIRIYITHSGMVLDNPLISG